MLTVTATAATIATVVGPGDLWSAIGHILWLAAAFCPHNQHSINRFGGWQHVRLAALTQRVSIDERKHVTYS